MDKTEGFVLSVFIIAVTFILYNLINHSTAEEVKNKQLIDSGYEQVVVETPKIETKVIWQKIKTKSE